MTDTSTPDGRLKRTEELAEQYKATGNKVGLVRLIGGSIDDFGDYTPADAGEEPHRAFNDR